MDAFWRPCERIFRPFWGHVEVKNRLGSSLKALFRLEVDLESSTPPILKDFGAPPPKIFNLGPSVRGKQGEPHRPMVPLTGSADFFKVFHWYAWNVPSWRGL